MFNIILPILLFIGIVIWICFRLTNWKQRTLFLLILFVAIPAAMLYWFKWGWKNREEKLMKAQIECRKTTLVEGLHLIFNGYTEKEMADSCFTIHKKADGQILDSNQQKVNTRKVYDGSLFADYYYSRQFLAGEILEISIGKKSYIFSNFVLTAIANYNMGGAVVTGCRIDSADINGKELPLIRI